MDHPTAINESINDDNITSNNVDSKLLNENNESEGINAGSISQEILKTSK